MRRLFLVIGIVVLGALACNDPVSQLPTTPSPPGIGSIELNGPETIAPGQSAQLIAAIRLSDGTIKNSGTIGTQWFSSNTGVLQVNSTGVATARQQHGEARITVVVGAGPSQRSASRDVVVVPDGTFRVAGVVSDAESQAFLVGGARVEATPGSAVAMTNSAGQYRLYGVPANAVIQVSKAGYAPVTLGVQLTEHATRDFQLVLSGPRALVSGLYTLTLDIAGGCPGGGALSPDLRRRVYEATVTQNGPAVEVVLTEPRFRTNSIFRGNRFTGFADAAGVTFRLDPFDSYYYPNYGPTSYPNVAERLSNGSFLVPQGQAFVVGAGAGVSGGFNAVFYNFDSRFPISSTSLLGFCSSSAAQLTLTPR